jgi:protein TonB
MIYRKWILCLLGFATAYGHAQEKLTRVVDNDKASKLTEIYYVQKSENAVKQGEYTLIGFDKKVYVSGKYVNNQRTGVWKFYGNSGELTRQFDFDKDSLVEYKWNKNDSTVMRVKTFEGWKRKEVSSPPFPLYSDLSFIIGHNLTYPAKAKQDGVRGTVVIAIRIDRTGVVLARAVKTKVDVLLDTEAMRIVNQIVAWYPAICDGKKMECEYLIPVKFGL